MQSTAEEIAALARADADADEMANSMPDAPATVAQPLVEQAPIAPRRVELGRRALLGVLLAIRAGGVL